MAGSAAALIAAETYQLPVSLLFAGSVPSDCNSYWAQGGIIYKNDNPSSGDSTLSLVQDIIRAGAGLCQEDAVWKVAKEGPNRVEELLLKGFPFAQVPFDRTEDGELSCCLEASHAAPRILHYADHTGKIITQHITAAAANHPLITLVPNTIVTDLIVDDHHAAPDTDTDTDTDTNMCLGVETYNPTTHTHEKMYAAHGTVLCAGGLGGIYEHSTNPMEGFNALGSSVALAKRADVTTQDLEYVQFHPTSLCIPNEARFLLTEAMRGEGAILKNADGYAFAKDFHEMGELAPRDIVARGVFHESQKQTKPTRDKQQPPPHNVFLDISHRDADYLVKRFPSIQEHLLKKGLDITKDPLPITPAAHYTCGGIVTDLHGKTSLTNLYAAGEAARTGLHGGNRLASTSLLEGLVFGASVADYIGSQQGQSISQLAHQRSFQKMTTDVTTYPTTGTATTINNNISKNDGGGGDLVVMNRAKELLKQVRSIMWDHVGLVRNPSGLKKALDQLDELIKEANALYSERMCKETIGLRDAAFSGRAVAEAALANRVSAGAHCIFHDNGDEYDNDNEYCDDSDDLEENRASASVI